MLAWSIRAFSFAIWSCDKSICAKHLDGAHHFTIIGNPWSFSSKANLIPVSIQSVGGIWTTRMMGPSFFVRAKVTWPTGFFCPLIVWNCVISQLVSLLSGAVRQATVQSSYVAVVSWGV